MYKLHYIWQLLIFEKISSDRDIVTIAEIIEHMTTTLLEVGLTIRKFGF